MSKQVLNNKIQNDTIMSEFRRSLKVGSRKERGCKQKYTRLRDTYFRVMKASYSMCLLS